MRTSIRPILLFVCLFVNFCRKNLCEKIYLLFWIFFCWKKVFSSKSLWINFSKETRFDLCLFWDFLNYLDDKALRAFNTALRPYLHQSTRAHAFTVRTLNTKFSNQQYGIEQAHMFSIRPRPGKQARTTPHTQAILVNLLSSFDIDQGMLLPDGRLEVLMTACLQEQATGAKTGSG